MIELLKIKKTFDGNRYVLNDLNLKINKGDYCQIVGKSGAGKSTLLNLIGLIDCNYTGYFYFDGIDIANLSDSQMSRLRSERLGFIFQSYNLINHMTVWENICMPVLYSARTFDKAFITKIEQLIDEFGIRDISNTPVQYLSGGEKQRVSIARSLVLEPDVILADEPTGNLDDSNGDIVKGILKKLSREGRTIVLVTHDIKRNWGAEKILLLKEGTFCAKDGFVY